VVIFILYIATQENGYAIFLHYSVTNVAVEAFWIKDIRFVIDHILLFVCDLEQKVHTQYAFRVLVTLCVCMCYLCLRPALDFSNNVAHYRQSGHFPDLPGLVYYSMISSKYFSPHCRIVYHGVLL